MHNLLCLTKFFQAERGEWLQFQADLQVAVSVADRLRAEAEEELKSLRKSHEDLERELAAAQQRQKEADVQLVTLRGELKESQQRLATLAQAPCQEAERPKGESYNLESKEGAQRDRVAYRLGREGSSGEEVKTDTKGISIRYLRNVTNEDRSGNEVQSSDTRTTATSERSR